MTDTVSETIPEEAGNQAKTKRKCSLSAQVFIGLGFGIAAGVFFGDLIAPIEIVGQIFIGLLQMTVLPYILVSLIAGIGRLSYAEMKMLGYQGGRFILLFWAVGLLVTVAFMATLPDWESATFFSSSLVETGSPVDLVKLYIPSNPFLSLAQSIVPAIVLFSIAIGLAVIGIPKKGSFLDDLDVVGEAIMRIAGFVARLAPIGVFALTASAAGTIDIQALGRLQVYILTYIGAALLLSFWVLPKMVSIMTPIPYKRVLSATQEALVTAFATGSLLIVLPLLSDRMKELLDEAHVRGQEVDTAVDLVVPINFNLPNLGKLMSLAFVPFAGWFAGSGIGFHQLPLFLSSGLLSFFGEVVVALPFLLDLMHVPSDMFELFLAVDVFTGRFATLVAGVHTIALGILTASAVSGKLNVSRWKLSRFAIISLLMALALFGGLRFFFEKVVPQEYREYKKLVHMDLLIPKPDSRTLTLAEATPIRGNSHTTRLETIRQRGSLRAGYFRDTLPFVYRNDDGKIVGLEADMVSLLASELGVRLEFVEMKKADIADNLATGRIDIALGGLLVTPERSLELRFSAPYLNATMSFVVPDHRRSELDSNAKVHAVEHFTVATVNLPYYSNFLSRRVPNAEVVVIESPREFFKAQPGKFDALLYTAEGGSAWTIVYPEYAVVVPKPNTVRAPIALAMPLDTPRFSAYVDAWLMLQREGTVLERLKDYWILGKGTEDKQPRWSIIRNGLGWIH